MKRFLALLLAALCLLACLSGCVAGGADQAAETDSQLAPEQAATQAAESTQDKMSLSDIIRVPFGYLLEWLYQFANNYGVALILFSLIIKLILLPMSIKSKKSTLKMSRLAPIVKAMESKYGDDKQKYQMAVQQLYKEEGVSMGGGCLWSFIPLLILLPLYYVIREPLTYMLHNSRSVSAAIVAFVRASGENLGANTYYAQLAAAGKLGAYVEPLRALAVTANANLTAIDFSFLGLDLAAIPTFKIWEVAKEGWSQIGLFLLPIASAGFQMLSMLISQKMSGQVATNADGERDEEAAKQQAQDKHDHDAHDAAHVAVDRLFHARGAVDLLDRAGAVRHGAGLFPHHPLPQDLRRGGRRASGARRAQACRGDRKGAPAPASPRAEPRRHHG